MQRKKTIKVKLVNFIQKIFPKRIINLFLKISDVIIDKIFRFVIIPMVLLIGGVFDFICFICYSVYRGIRILLGKGDSGKYVPLTFVVIDENIDENSK